MLHRQYPQQARSARLRLLVAGGPGRFAMIRSVQGRPRSLEVFLRQHGQSQEYPHSVRYPLIPSIHGAGLARCKTKHGRAASASPQL